VWLTCGCIKQELLARRANSSEDLNVDDLLTKRGLLQGIRRNIFATHDTDIQRSSAADVSDGYRLAHGDHATTFHVRQNSILFVAVASERLAFSRERRCAATANRISTLNGKVAAIDVKTGRGVYPECTPQLAVYPATSDETNGGFSKLCFNFHLNRDLALAESRVFTTAELLSLFKIFKAAKRLSEWLSENMVSARARQHATIRTLYLRCDVEASVTRCRNDRDAGTSERHIDIEHLTRKHAARATVCNKSRGSTTIKALRLTHSKNVALQSQNSPQNEPVQTV